MSKLIFPMLSAAAFAISIGSAAVYASDSNLSASGSNVAQGQVNTTPSAPMNAQASDHHGLTRHDVYNQLVQAQKDGTLARLDALYYGP
jgi:hypothetical protein